MRATNPTPARRQAGILGIGLDATDGHQRITRGKNFLLAGGSEETHGRLRETVVKVNEQLDGQRKRLEDVSAQEFRDLVHDVASKL